MPYECIWQIACALKRQQKTMTLIVGDNLSNFQVDRLIEASGDHFDIKFAPTVPNYSNNNSHEEV